MKTINRSPEPNDAEIRREMTGFIARLISASLGSGLRLIVFIVASY